MRWKSLAIVVVLNIFAVLFFNVIYEYISLADRFRQIEDTIYPAVESAIEASTAGEELFSDKSDIRMLSDATAGDFNLASRSGRHTRTRTPYDDDTTLQRVNDGVMIYDRKSGTIQKVDAYKLSLYYGINGELPYDVGTLDSAPYNNLDTSAIFSYLYGGVGTSYNDPNLSWANKNSITQSIYAQDSSYSTIDDILNKNITHDRKPNNGTRNAIESYNLGITLKDWAREANNFEDYFKDVGSKVYSYSFMKKKDTTDTNAFKVACSPKDTRAASLTYTENDNSTVFPTLAQMGLELDSTYNSPTSIYMLDNFCSSIKIGKKTLTRASNQIKELKSSYYFLTPYSLGVTYVPVSVFKPVFTSVLDTNVRLRKCSSADEFDIDTLKQADDCVSTNVYATDTAEEHKTDEVNYGSFSTAISNNAQSGTDANNGKEFITNDGYIEYDMNSVKCKVDYFVYDIFGDEDASRQNKDAYLTTYLIGTKSGLGLASGEVEKRTIQAYNSDYNHNTSVNAYYDVLKNAQIGGVSQNVSGKRIIAKVSVKVKIHVPYRSSILQWACERTGVPGHYGIKQYDTSTGQIVADNDDLWYECETYYSNVR